MAYIERTSTSRKDLNMDNNSIRKHNPGLLGLCNLSNNVPNFLQLPVEQRLMNTKIFIISYIVVLFLIDPVSASEPFCPDGSNPDPNVIWCDDFDDLIPLSQKYFEYDDDEGDFVPVAEVGLNGTYAMQVKWQAGETDAGNIKRTFGRSPVNSQSHSTTDFREIYWRQYLKMQEGWTGNSYKLSRATILATSGWAQAMIAHLWGDGADDTLIIDPASGIDGNGNLVTTRYNDFANLRWLGIERGTTPIFSDGTSGKWYCIEAHVKLNTPGLSDGIFEYWIDGDLEANKTDLDWVNTWQEYGINTISFENYWNNPPNERIRYFDNIVISTQSIGCIDTVTPNVPKNLRFAR